MKQIFKPFVSIMLAIVLLLSNIGRVCQEADASQTAEVVVKTPETIIKINMPDEFKGEDVESEDSFAYRVLDSTDLQHTYNWSNVINYEGYADETKENGIVTIVSMQEPYEEGAYDISRVNEEYPEAPERPAQPDIDYEILTEKINKVIIEAMCADKGVELPENYEDMDSGELADILGFEDEEEFQAARMEYSEDETLFSDIPEYQQLQEYSKKSEEYKEVYSAYQAKYVELSAIKAYAFKHFYAVAAELNKKEWEEFFANELNQDPEIRFEDVEVLDYYGKQIIHATVYAEDPDDETGVYEYYRLCEEEAIVTLFGGTLFGTAPSQLASDTLANMTVEENDEPSIPVIKNVTVLSEEPFEVNVQLEGKNNGGIIVATLLKGEEALQVITKPAAFYLNFCFDEEYTGDGVRVMWLESMNSLKPMCESKEEYVYPVGDGYAYLLSVNSDLSFNVFTSSGNFVRLFAADNIVINGVSYKKNDKEILNVLEASAEAANASYSDEVNSEYNQPIVYSIDKEGYLTIDTVLSSENSDISMVMDDGAYYSDYGYRQYKSSSRSFTDFKASSATDIIFVPDDRSNLDDYIAFSSYSKAFMNTNNYHVEAYGLTATGTAALVLIYKENDTMYYTSSSPMMIVESVTEGENGTVVNGYAGTSYTLNSVNVNGKKLTDTTSLGKGDIIRYLVDRDGNMTDYQIWFDMSSPTQLNAASQVEDLYYADGDGINRILEMHSTSKTPRQDYPSATFRLQYGTVAELWLNNYETSLTILPTIVEDDMEMAFEGMGVVSRNIGSLVKVFSFDRSDANAEVVTAVDLADLCAYNTCGEYASRVVTYSQAGALKMIYIIKDGPYEEHEETKIEYDYPENYAYLLSVEQTDSILKFNMLLTSGVEKTFTNDSKITIDSVEYDATDKAVLQLLKDSAVVANSSYPDETNVLYHQPIRYEYRGDSTVFNIYTVKNTENATISAVMGEDYHAPYNYRQYISSSKSFTDFKVSSSTKIMFIPDNRNLTDDYLTFSSYSKAFANGRNYHVEAYGLTNSGTAALVLIYKQNDSRIYTSSSPWMIVASKSETKNGTIIKGYQGTSYSLKSVTVSEDKCPSIASIGKGDIIRYIVDDSSRLIDYQIWFDASDPSQLETVSTNDDLYVDEEVDTTGANRIIEIHSTKTTPVKNYPNATFRLQYGTVTELILKDGEDDSIDEESITVSPVLVEDNLDMDYFDKEDSENKSTISETIGSFVKVFSFDRNDENAEVIAEADLTDVCAYNTCGENASRVIIYTASGTLRMVYIVKDKTCPKHDDTDDATELPTEDGEYDDPNVNDKDNTVNDTLDDGWISPGGSSGGDSNYDEDDFIPEEPDWTEPPIEEESLSE